MKQRIVAATLRPELWLLALLCWLLLSAGRSLGTPWARAALTEALRWGTGIGLALALGALLRHTGRAARLVVVLAGAVALLGMAGGPHPVAGGLCGPYQDHQLYGGVLLLLLPPAVAVALTARDGRWRLGAVAASGAGALCLALSQTRSAWAGALAAALVFGLLWLSRPGRRWVKRRSVLLGAAALAGAVLAVWLLLAPPDLRAPLAARAGTLSRLGTDGSWQDRVTVWRGASRLAAAHPLGGIGLGRYPGAQWAWTRAGRPLAPSERPSLSEEAHDLYLQTAAETGLVGLGLYGAALAAFVFQGLRRLRQPRRHRAPGQDALVIASLSLVAGQAVDALASPSWQFAEASLLFWALLGVGMAAMRGEEPEAAPTRVPRPLRRAGRLALSGGVSVALAANVLPLGLLTPVEAYTATADGTYVVGSVTISGPTSIVAGQTATYFLTATYTNSQHQTRTVDVSLDPVSPMMGRPSTYGVSTLAGSNRAGVAFGVAGTSNRNVLSTSAGPNSSGGSGGDKFTVGGGFYDSASTGNERFAPPMTVSVQ